jgi:inhibitor of cysteine peptidase
VEKTIKKKTTVYAIAAVILSTILVAFCLNYGIILTTTPVQPESSSNLAFMKNFSSQDELRNYLLTQSTLQGAFPYFGPFDAINLGSQYGAQIGSIMPSEVKGLSVAGSNAESYSTTNVQVAGVDEADMVKTDGEYIYLLSNNTVFIVKAYPPEQAAIISKLVFNDTYAVEIFVSGDRLAVLECGYNDVQPYPYLGFWSNSRPFTINVKTSIEVFDISDKAHPTHLADFTMSGSYFNSRMIGDYVYLVASQPAYVIYDTVILPKIYSPNGIMDIPAKDIQYLNKSDDYYQYTTIVAMNIQNTSETPTHTTMLLGGATTMYVSLQNIYVTFPDTGGQTSIYRISTDKARLTCEATGKVEGSILNQFMMDEKGDYFRVATSTWKNNNPQTNLYVLDMNLTVVGRLEGIAEGETMNSARFIEDRCYLSTSVMRRDPFFVIDVGNATEPKILGDLKIPGFTSYLHPFDANHVIGVGKDGNLIKITLFDVSNVTAPINMSEYTVQGYWSDTPVLSDHRAFLFDANKNLLVIPLSINTYDYVVTNGTVGGTLVSALSYWQGAYIFNATLTGGFELRGNVTHISQPENCWDSSGIIKRTLYIQNDLYTVSDKKIQINDLDNLQLLKDIPLA